MNLIFKRFIAYCLDYLLIVIYASILFLLSYQLGVKGLSPWQGQALGFITLTLPVFLYFYLCEKSSYKATFGKRLMNISVDSYRNERSRNIFLRNLLKFLPWEVAHTGVHWVIFYSEKPGSTVPLWVYILLIIPQVVVIIYIVTIILSGGQLSLYDKASNTIVKNIKSKYPIYPSQV